MDRAQAEEWIREHVEPAGAIEVEKERSWATTLRVPTRDGARWTLNFGRPVAAALIAVVLVIGIVGPAIILRLLLR